jgi:hypothetical protein
MRASVLALCFWLAGVAAAQPAPASKPPIMLPAPASPTPIVQPVLRPEPAKGNAIVPVQMAAPAGPVAADDPALAFANLDKLPGVERLFRLDSEEAFFQRMRQEARGRRSEELVFPEEPLLSRTPYYGRDWPRMKMEVEPHFVCHGRLLFEQLNFERYGWEIGVFQPLISSALFYKDVLLLPYHLASYPHRCYDCSKGKCLPGDPVPLILYPPELTVTGAAAELLTIAALCVMFP